MGPLPQSGGCEPTRQAGHQGEPGPGGLSPRQALGPKPLTHKSKTRVLSGTTPICGACENSATVTCTTPPHATSVHTSQAPPTQVHFGTPVSLGSCCQGLPHVGCTGPLRPPLQPGLLPQAWVLGRVSPRSWGAEAGGGGGQSGPGPGVHPRF